MNTNFNYHDVFLNMYYMSTNKISDALVKKKKSCSYVFLDLVISRFKVTTPLQIIIHVCKLILPIWGSLRI